MTSTAMIETAPLSKGEISKGNALFLKLLKLNFIGSDVECAKYESSYDELFKVSRAIIDLEGKDGMVDAFEYRHVMFHQVLNFPYFYRKTVLIVERYYENRIELEVV